MLHREKGKDHFRSYNPSTIFIVFEMISALNRSCSLKRPGAGEAVEYCSMGWVPRPTSHCTASHRAHRIQTKPTSTGPWSRQGRKTPPFHIWSPA